MFKFILTILSTLSFAHSANANTCPKHVFVHWVIMDPLTLDEDAIFEAKGFDHPFEPPHQPWHAFSLQRGTLIWEKYENATSEKCKTPKGRLSILNMDVTTDIVGHIINLKDVSTVIFEGNAENLPFCKSL